VSDWVEIKVALWIAYSNQHRWRVDGIDPWIRLFKYLLAPLIIFIILNFYSRFFDGENKTTLGIFYTNDMTFTNDSAALFPNMARANHSCTPNSDFVARHHLGELSISD
jgi:hypothetical protein